jgi:hypothetical protein
LQAEGASSSSTDPGGEPSAGATPAVSFWSIANTLTDTVKKRTEELKASLRDTDWRSELGALQVGLKEDTADLAHVAGELSHKAVAATGELGQKAKAATGDLGHKALTVTGQLSQKAMAASGELSQRAKHAAEQLPSVVEHLPGNVSFFFSELLFTALQASLTLSQLVWTQIS